MTDPLALGHVREARRHLRLVLPWAAMAWPSLWMAAKHLDAALGEPEPKPVQHNRHQSGEWSEP